MSTQDYSLDYLLDRAYKSFSLNKEKLKLVVPILERKDKKSYISNFQDVCRSIGRDPNDIKVYISREFQMDTSIKETGCLKMDGLIKSVGIIESVFKGYVIDFVMCKSCKSCNTHNEKLDRVTYLICDTCKSKRAIDK